MMVAIQISDDEHFKFQAHQLEPCCASCATEQLPWCGALNISTVVGIEVTMVEEFVWTNIKTNKTETGGWYGMGEGPKLLNATR